MSSIKFIFLFIACLCVSCGCAMQQDVIALYDRMNVLEQRCENLEQSNIKLKKETAQVEALIQESTKKQEEKDRYHRTGSADIHVVLDKLRKEIASLNGQIEETQHMLKQKTDVLNKAAIKRKEVLDKIEEMSTSNYTRIKDIQQYLNLESSGSDLKANDTRGNQKKLSENEIYTSAKHAFDQGNFEPAREGFQEIIKQYPKSKNADNAQFWIGEIYYREKWYEKAILEYQKVIEKYPKGNKVPASLLKQGFSFLALGEKSNARLILNELATKHPKSNEAKIAKQKLKGLK